MLDGFVARALHTESEAGAKLDSIADLIFAGAYAVRILPLLKLPNYFWIWIAVIAVTKLICIVLASRKAHQFAIAHSFWNKLTGLFAFLLPLSVHIVDINLGATLVCATATATVLIEVFQLLNKFRR